MLKRKGSRLLLIEFVYRELQLKLDLHTVTSEIGFRLKHFQNLRMPLYHGATLVHFYLAALVSATALLDSKCPATHTWLKYHIIDGIIHSTNLLLRSDAMISLFN
jgi:hypothetical protein